MHSKIIHYRPPRIAMTLVALAAALHGIAATGHFKIFASSPIGAALFALGFVVMISAWWQFQRHDVLICPTAPTARLITGGLYRYSRNPMYLGMVLMLAGIAVYFGTVPFYAAVLLYAVLIDRHFCHFEEQKLRDTFGEEYDRYAGRVRRWI